MLKELNRYENLGTPKFFYELFQQLSISDRGWTKDNIKEYFYNRIVENRAVFDGCLPLIERIGAITIDVKGIISINPLLQESLINERYFTNRLLEMIIVSIKNDEVFYEIFCQENISYDIIYRLIQIENTAFSFRYRNFRQLLINFSFLYPHPNQKIKKYTINSRYKKLFDEKLKPEIERRRVGIDGFERMLELKRIHGKEGEVFALKYEKERMSSHKNVDNIEIISDYDIGAGYDIVSFETLESIQYDRFIEAKSFSGTPTFYWSRNEIDTARIKKDSYFLYLVDRDKVSVKDYIPTIVQNPYNKIIENSSDWEKIPESYYIIMKTNGTN